MLCVLLMLNAKDKSLMGFANFHMGINPVAVKSITEATLFQEDRVHNPYATMEEYKNIEFVTVPLGEQYDKFVVCARPNSNPIYISSFTENSDGKTDFAISLSQNKYEAILCTTYDEALHMSCVASGELCMHFGVHIFVDEEET